MRFYQGKFEEEKEAKTNTIQKMRELKTTLRQLTTRKAELLKMNSAY